MCRGSYGKVHNGLHRPETRLMVNPPKVPLITVNASTGRHAPATGVILPFFRAIHDTFFLLFKIIAQFRLIIPETILRAIHDTVFVLFTIIAQLRQIILETTQLR